MSVRAELVALLGERDFQDTLITEAQSQLWRCCHFRPAETKKGWRTAVSADGAGYPDLTLVRAGYLIFAELKTNKGRLTPQQTMWAEHLTHVAASNPLVAYYCWRPHDWPQIEATLRRVTA